MVPMKTRVVIARAKGANLGGHEPNVESHQLLVVKYHTKAELNAIKGD